MQRILYDIEVYKNFFCVGLKDYDTGKITFYEVSEERDDRDAIYTFFNNYKGFLISFNGLYYDNMVIKYFLSKYKSTRYLNAANLCIELKYFSDKVIEDLYDDKDIKEMKWMKTSWIDIDLFAYWSKMLRLSKKISLKSLGIQLGYDVVQELPFSPDTILKKEDLPSLRYYNYTHDLGILELLTRQMDSEIALRASVVKDFGLDCWSWDAPKIASEALLKDYCTKTRKSVNTVRKERFTRPTLYIDKILEGFNPHYELPVFKELFERIKSSVDTFSEDIIVNLNNTNIRLTYGVGGLHSVNKDESYFSDENVQVVTSDVTSLYPNLIINYQCIRYPEVLTRYSEIKDERVVAKKAGIKSKDTFFKLILNSTSGLLDNQHSWLYYPEGALKLRLIGQLILTKCIEVCIQNNWQVVSANTDGIEVIVPKEQLDEYYKVLDDAIALFNIGLEHELYDFIIYKNVNNYIARTNKGSKKLKGLFVHKPVLGNSVDTLVIAKALEAYYSEGIDVEEFISHPEKYNLTIYDYCKSNKIDKSFFVVWNNKVQQQLNRYYFSKGNHYLFKYKKNSGYSLKDLDSLAMKIMSESACSLENAKKEAFKIILGNKAHHVNVGEGVQLFNTYKDLTWSEYNINYDYYIRAARKIIREISRYNQLTLF